MFRELAIIVVAITVAAPALAQTRVDGYVRKDGAYVPPHVRSAPDGNRSNNWTTSPNVNPYTGERGTRSPNTFDPPRTTNPYGSNGLYGSQRRY
jgi:hypothetical protein